MDLSEERNRKDLGGVWREKSIIKIYGKAVVKKIIKISNKT